MKYIIMCGCQSDEVTPRHLIKINGEELAARTIRLLRDEGIREIYISTNHEAFFKFDVPIIKHFNAIYDHPGKYSYWVDGFFPMDYKIHCANGKPVFIQCCFERTSGDAGRRVIYDTNWKNLHYILNDSHYSNEEVERPKHLSEMLKAASVLSKGLKYARMDFYDTDKRVIFGEITLTPMGGWLSYFKQEALDLMGKAIREGK